MAIPLPCGARDYRERVVCEIADRERRFVWRETVQSEDSESGDGESEGHLEEAAGIEVAAGISETEPETMLTEVVKGEVSGFAIFSSPFCHK